MKPLFPEINRRSDGKFATPEQALHDKTKKRNAFLEYRVNQLESELKVFKRAILNRTLIYNLN